MQNIFLIHHFICPQSKNKLSSGVLLSEWIFVMICHNPIDTFKNLLVLFCSTRKIKIGEPIWQIQQHFLPKMMNSIYFDYCVSIFRQLSVKQSNSKNLCIAVLQCGMTVMSMNLDGASCWHLFLVHSLWYLFLGACDEEEKNILQKQHLKASAKVTDHQFMNPL